MGTTHGLNRAALRAGLLGLSTAAALIVAAPAAMAASADVAGGSLDWGFKASFRGYVSGGNGTPPIAATNGASINADGTFDFPAGSGTYDAAAGTASVQYQGTIVFSYPLHGFTITIANPKLVVDGDGEGSLLADVDLTATTQPSAHVDGAELATVTTTAPTVTDGAVTFSNLAAKLSAGSASVFGGFYATGAALDPITASASASSGSGPTDPTDPTDPTEPGNGSTAQTIKAAVAGGALTLTSAGSDVNLSAATPGQTATGNLNAVTVSDLRGTNAGWDLVGQVTDFTSAAGTIPAANLGWTPTAAVVATGLKAANGVQNAVTPGGPVTPGSGLGASKTLCSAETGSSLGSSTCGAALNLGVPESSAAGEYSAVLTLTLA
ncbi:hypothetical protein BJ973_002310 [Actinoplanes tereljensis]|uniref:WxL domain-containing protein n=1 Tax=Paractinoplanes tereljensis TaxID=571912 RepID=A0A919NN92_9ACTN|nr:HtaA domain-containing protein [Actinoplanes tereljensis]GIF21984.1 hypothetical protein Ate02nite_47140 [Actinoplanes tereljensis]